MWMSKDTDGHDYESLEAESGVSTSVLKTFIARVHCLLAWRLPLRPVADLQRPSHHLAAVNRLPTHAAHALRLQLAVVALASPSLKVRLRGVEICGEKSSEWFDSRTVEFRAKYFAAKLQHVENRNISAEFECRPTLFRKFLPRPKYFSGEKVDVCVWHAVLVNPYCYMYETVDDRLWRSSSVPCGSRD